MLDENKAKIEMIKTNVLLMKDKLNQLKTQRAEINEMIEILEEKIKEIELSMSSFVDVTDTYMKD